MSRLTVELVIIPPLPIWFTCSVQEEELQGRISDLERELETVLLKVEQYESKESRDVENSELLMAEYNAAFQDLNSVVEVRALVSSVTFLLTYILIMVWM